MGLDPFSLFPFWPEDLITKERSESKQQRNNRQRSKEGSAVLFDITYKYP
jgi:hypothetical protein